MIKTTMIGPAPHIGDGDAVGDADIAVRDARPFEFGEGALAPSADDACSPSSRAERLKCIAH